MQTIETKKLIWSSGVAIFLGALFNVLFFEERAGLNFPLFIILTLTGIWVLIKKFSIKNIDGQTTTLSVLALFFSVMVFVRSSPLLSFFNVIGTGLLILIIVDSHFGKKIKDYLFSDYLKIFILPLKFIRPFFEKISEYLTLIKKDFSPKTREIVRGILLTLIALLVFTLLFASADIVFGKIIKNIFSFEISDAFVGRTILFIFVSSFFIGAFGYLFRKIHLNTEKPTDNKIFSLGTIETKIFLISVNILFFVFIIFQLTYLFGGESHLLSQGITYAEYARKGFVELIFVALLSFIIISFAERQVLKKENKHLGFFKILSSVMIAQVIVILISAFVRLSLYEQAYGFSTIRLYSYALMIWIGLVLILLSYHIIRNGNQTKLALRVFGLVVLLLLSMNIINPDVFIAKKNITRYQETGKIDESYLANLSDDALPYTISLLNDSNENVRARFAYELFWVNDKKENYSWKSNKLTSSKANHLILENKNILEENKNLFIVD